MAGGGVEQLLTTLCGPLARWRPPVFDVAHPHNADIHLNGRGPITAPTMFSTPQVELLYLPLDLARTPTLAVRTLSGTSLDTALREGIGESTAQSLDDLLGRTRAAVLRASVGECGTTELARRLNISPATACHHATVLRNAYLITTRCEGKAVLHTATSLGIAVVDQRYPSPDGEAGPRPGGSPEVPWPGTFRWSSKRWRLSSGGVYVEAPGDQTPQRREPPNLTG
ncbi:ArsR/SmtB family transcription factor [Streptomyces sp. 3213.3]|uniref:ArsR/SmtB family transcription factor n=1 Tax=Streptomyces sp. 3213.3 TaxID=1855348 RepID=UPI001F311A64|nr:winged helix-turn-helix domain-containing protein [Streptomyces sp. 3213.3]